MGRIMLVGSIAIVLELTVPALAAPPYTTTDIQNSATTCTNTDIQNLVCETGSYNPPNPANGGSYSPPTCTSTSNGNKTAVGNAFDLAPVKVKLELCALKKIIIQTDATAVLMGFWENPLTKSASGGRPNSYILIRSDSTTSNLKKVLNDNFTSVFKNTTPGLNPDHTVTADSVSLGLLAVLAHEVGHIKWHRDNIYSSLGCYYDNFVGANAWKADGQLATSVVRPWHPDFADANAGGLPNQRASHADNQAPDPHKSGLSPGQVRNLYTKGFVSAAAGISPEEDFVETYALLTILNVSTPPMITLSITNGGNSVMIPDDSSLPKRNCVAPLIN
jgi:hypothetical protein